MGSPSKGGGKGFRPHHCGEKGATLEPPEPAELRKVSCGRATEVVEVLAAGRTMPIRQ